MKFFSYRRRPVYLGPFPAEHLKRAPLPVSDNGPRAPRPLENGRAPAGSLAAIAAEYLEVFGESRDGQVAEEPAPIETDPQQLTNELKSACYFLDAAQAAVCELPGSAIYEPAGDEPSPTASHTHALVILIEHGRPVERHALAHDWVEGSQPTVAAVRGAEIAVVLAGYIRRLGYSARAHTAAQSDVVHDALVVRAGLAQEQADTLINPYLGHRFSTAVVTTDLALAPDRPLAPQSLRDRSLRHLVGRDGTRSGWQRWREHQRASHLGRYPMERIKRVDEATTLILEDEIPRVPKRAAFFERALHGDLGPKAARERRRFAVKHPFTNAMSPLIRAMVPLQDGPVEQRTAPGTDDPAANAQAVKSLLHVLDADMVGICAAKPFTWFSHGDDGNPLEVRHEWAIVVVIDQGHETMEGASGDDWISGGQSMRAYVRGAEICGQAAAFIRRLGYSARSHTNALSDVLHIPLVLMAGLGELSRIGELVLNPYLGPRFKTAVITTDMPLVPDRPIDFGLQDMCNKCMKCARECPCDAISYGDKVMFNGYEIWKPDVQRCTSYRVTNPHGSACGRCMKTCPYNHEGLLVHRVLLWAAIHLPFTRRWIAILDDKVGNGSRNLVKKWWSDLEWLPTGVAVIPKGVNQRDLDIAKGFGLRDKQKMAYYHANAMPPPDATEPVPVDRKAGMAAADVLETPADARQRRLNGGPIPAHYVPTPPRHATAPVVADD